MVKKSKATTKSVGLMPLAIDPADRKNKTAQELNRMVDPARGLTLAQEYDLAEKAQQQLREKAAATLTLKTTGKRTVLCSGENIVGEVESFRLDEHQRIASLKLRDDEKFTLDEAFSFFYEPFEAKHDENAEFHLERAIRSVAYLLTWSTQLGNEQPDGNAINGLARILDRAADDVAFFARRRRKADDTVLHREWRESQAEANEQPVQK